MYRITVTNHKENESPSIGDKHMITVYDGEQTLIKTVGASYSAPMTAKSYEESYDFQVLDGSQKPFGHFGLSDGKMKQIEVTITAIMPRNRHNVVFDCKAK